MFNVLTQNSSEIPIMALIAEGLALVVYLYLAVNLGNKWRNRRVRPTFNLFMSFLFYLIAVLFLFSTKSTDFITGDLYNLSTIGINLGYAFSLIGNVFLYFFTEDIFFEQPKAYLREIITFGNGITFGFLMIFILQVQAFPFLEIPGVYIPPHLLIWHVLISTIGFLVLFGSAYRASRKTNASIQKAGFFMITLTAIFEILVFVFFFVDRFQGGGYTIWYFMAWLSASIAGLFASIGYLLPNWFKRLFK